MQPTLHMDIRATRKLATGQQRHFSPVFILRILGAIDETGQVTAILIAETPHLFHQLNLATQQRHQPLTGMMQHIDPVGAQLHEEIEGGMGRLLGRTSVV